MRAKQCRRSPTHRKRQQKRAKARARATFCRSKMRQLKKRARFPPTRFIQRWRMRARACARSLVRVGHIKKNETSNASRRTTSAPPFAADPRARALSQKCDGGGCDGEQANEQKAVNFFVAVARRLRSLIDAMRVEQQAARSADTRCLRRRRRRRCRRHCRHRRHRLHRSCCYRRCDARAREQASKRSRARGWRVALFLRAFATKKERANVSAPAKKAVVLTSRQYETLLICFLQVYKTIKKRK